MVDDYDDENDMQPVGGARSIGQVEILENEGHGQLATDSLQLKWKTRSRYQ